MRYFFIGLLSLVVAAAHGQKPIIKSKSDNLDDPSFENTLIRKIGKYAEKINAGDTICRPNGTASERN